MIGDIIQIESLDLQIYSSKITQILPREYQNCFPYEMKKHLLFRAISGYYLYYYAVKDSVICYCFLKKNYFHKYTFMLKGDLIINPYYVVPEYRGNGIAKQLINQVLLHRPNPSARIWAVVEKKNVPSVKVLQKVGFTFKGSVETCHWRHHISQTETPLELWCFESA